MRGGLEEAQEALWRDDRRLRVDERVELQRLGAKEIAVEDDPDLPSRVVHDGEGRHGAGGDAEPLRETLRAREREAPEAEGLGEAAQVERPVRREDDEPVRAAPLLEEEVLAVAPGHVSRREPRLGDGEDGVVLERPRFDAEHTQELEEAGRVVRAIGVVCSFVGRHRRDSEPAGRAGV